MFLKIRQLAVIQVLIMFWSMFCVQVTGYLYCIFLVRFYLEKHLMQNVEYQNFNNYTFLEFTLSWTSIRKFFCTLLHIPVTCVLSRAYEKLDGNKLIALHCVIKESNAQTERSCKQSHQIQYKIPKHHKLYPDSVGLHRNYFTESTFSTAYHCVHSVGSLK